MAKKTKDSHAFDYVLLAVVFIGLAFAIYNTITIATHFGSGYQKALSAQNATNICATPSGYTDEQWREHMSHHPDRYKECLGG